MNSYDWSAKAGTRTWLVLLPIAVAGCSTSDGDAAGAGGTMGAGGGAPAVKLSAESLPLDMVCLYGSQVMGSLRVTNDSTREVRVDIDVTQTSGPAKALVKGGPDGGTGNVFAPVAPIAPGASADIQIYASGGCCDAGPYAGRIDVRLDETPWKSVQVSGATLLPTYTVLTPGPIELTEKDLERDVTLRNDSIAAIELGSPVGYRWVGNGGAGCRFIASPLSLAPGATGAVRVRFTIESGTAACDVSSKLEFRQVRSDACGDTPPFAVIDVHGTKGS